MLEFEKREVFKAISMTENDFTEEKYNRFNEILQEQLSILKSECMAEAGTILLYIIKKNNGKDPGSVLEMVLGTCSAFISQNPERAMEINKHLEQIYQREKDGCY